MLKPVLGSQLQLGHPPLKGLVGYWLMNEGSGSKVADLSGNSNDGILIATAHFVPGKFGYALNLDGSSGYVLVPHHSSLNINNLTISAWVRTANSDGIDQYITTKKNDSWYFCIGPAGQTANKISVYLSGVSAGWLQGSKDLNDDLWHHVAITWDGRVIRVFTDGIQENSTNRTGTLDSGIESVRLGWRATGGDHFTGDISHIMIYNRGLSAQEVASLYTYPFQMFEEEI